MRPFWDGEASRRIVKRIIVEATLTLVTPAHIGNGDSDDLTDMPLFVAPDDGKTPLLTGTSLAGAMRSYLRQREHGYEGSDLPSTAAIRLLGGAKQDPDGEQSPLIVEDCYGTASGTEMRDGVAIDGASRTAADTAKFDVQLWQAGTTFPLRFELLIRQDDSEAALCCALASALQGFEDGHITLGARKRRGYGRVIVENWRIRAFDLETTSGLISYLQEGGEALTTKALTLARPQQELGVTTLLTDRRQVFEMKAQFTLYGSLLIRSAGSEGEKGPDVVYLRSKQRDGTEKAVLSGTSLGGALRARAHKIVNTVSLAPCRKSLVEKIFGLTEHASRLDVWEEAVEGGTTNLVQNRVSIDRFTGGARQGALFNQQPVFGNAQTQLHLTCRLRIPNDHDSQAEIGLLLHLLKDLWTSDLPVGGESSVGRGRLQGQSARLSLLRNQAGGQIRQIWNLHQRGSNDLSLTSVKTEGEILTSLGETKARSDLESFTSAFWSLMRLENREEDSVASN